MSSRDYDLVILGAGGAASAAAIRASELGAHTAVVERSTIGGTCVNIGCIPSKTLLRAAEALHRTTAMRFDGIEGHGRLVDFHAVMAQKEQLVAELRQTKYVDVLGALPNVELLSGHAVFESPNQIRVGASTLRAPRFLVATGARPLVPPIPGLAEVGCLTSTSALSLPELPESLIVLGARYVGLELAQMFRRFGSRVTILQRSSHILPTEDDDVTDALAGYFGDEEIKILTGVRTVAVRRDASGFHVDVDVAGRRRTLRAAQLLAATGRLPNTDDLGLARAGVTLDARRAIQVDDTLATTAPHIFAAGDVKGDPAFVYTAAYEGRLAAENALTHDKRTRDYTALPWVMFTDPQLAVVGLDEGRARQAGIAVDVATLPLSHVPRAIAARDTRGLVKLVKERGGDRLLGATILAPEAGELIMEPTLAIRHGIGVSQLATALHPYLTQVEAIKLAAQMFTTDVRALSCCA